MRLTVGLMCLSALLFLDTTRAVDEKKEDTVLSRVKRGYGYGRRRGVVHKIINEHDGDDEHHDDYDELNFFGNDHDDYGGGYGMDIGGYGGGDDHYDDHGDYGNDDYGHNDYGHDDYGYGGGGGYGDESYGGGGYGGGGYGGGDGGYGGGYGGGGGGYGGGGGGYGGGGGGYGGGGGGYGGGKMKRGYRVVPKKYGYRKIYKPRVVVIQKIVPVSTTTMPMGR